jgi:hypothetical protein
VLATRGTPLEGQRVSPALLVWAVGAVAAGWGRRAVARVCEVDPKTVLQWWVEAAEPRKAVSQHCLHDVRGTPVPLDELSALLRAVKEGEGSETEAITRLARSPHWVWVALDPVTTWLLAPAVGARTRAMAQGVGPQVVQVLAPDCAPVFVTDGLTEDITALLPHGGHWVQPQRRQGQGPLPKPRGMPLPQLLSALVIKGRRRRRLVEVTHRVVFGTQAAVEQGLAGCGWQSKTAVIERVNLSRRPQVAVVGRRVMTLCTGAAGGRQQLALDPTSSNCCLPQASLRQPLPEPEPTHGHGSAKRWQPRPPALAAGLTEHVWTLREVRRFRVPPWPQPQAM